MMMKGYMLALLTVFVGMVLGETREPIRLAPETDEEIEENRRAMENEGMFQGDINNIDPEDRNAIRDMKKLWPNGKVYYVISPELMPHKSVIEGAMQEYQQKTKFCISYHQGTGNGNYISIESKDGCHSAIGMAGYGKQLLSLGDGCVYHSTALHELGHALGLYHEQNRSDRDKYVYIIWDNINPAFKNQFDILSPKENYLFVPFDFNSIMMYGKTSFTKNGKPTIIPKDPKIKKFGRSAHLSPGDLITISTLYSCLGYTHPPLPVVAYSCNFDNKNFCFFHNEGTGQFRFFSTNEGRFIAASQHNTDSELASNYFEYYGTAVISIVVRYKVLGNMQKNTIFFESNNWKFKKFLPLSQTAGWQTLCVNIRPTGNFKVTFYARTGSDGILCLDDFQYRRDYCPKN